jgi:hypothetical protein
MIIKLKVSFWRYLIGTTDKVNIKEYKENILNGFKIDLMKIIKNKGWRWNLKKHRENYIMKNIVDFFYVI